MEPQGNGIMSGIHLPHEEGESVVSSKGKLRIVNIVTSFNMAIFQICLRLGLSTHPRKNVHGAYGICNTKTLTLSALLLTEFILGHGF